MRTTLFLFGLAHFGVAADIVAKVYPGDPRWPTEEAWETLNTTIGGYLIKPSLRNTRSYSKTRVNECSGYDQSQYLSDPILVKAPWWGGFGCPDCPLKYATDTCSLGNHPNVVVKATRAEDVIAAVKFANEHNLRLVVKNTGHDFLGRSIGYGSLSVWTHGMKGIEWIDEWTPTADKNATPQSAVRFGSGTQWVDIYREAYTRDKIVTGGTSGSVGAAGWLMGGGHGSFSNKFGLGVDNLLEAEVVLPSGKFVVTNEKSYSDLFWALRGGGGGTFGVVTKMTMKAHDTETLNGIRISITADANKTGNAGFLKGMGYLMSVMPEWTDWGISGHPILQKYRFESLFTAPGKDASEITDFIEPYVTKLEEMGLTVWKFPIPSIMNSLAMSQGLAPNAAIDGNIGREGGPGIMGSRLLVRKNLADRKAMEKAIGFLMDKKYILEPFIVGGGAVSKNRNLKVSVNPVWRDAIVHLSILPSGQWGLKTVREVMASYNQTQRYTVDLLDQFSTGQAVYFNEASWMEPNWQTAYFGLNYPRLLEVKRKYDPNNTLWCHPCVGSEVFTRKDDGKLYITS